MIRSPHTDSTATGLRPRRAAVGLGGTLMAALLLSACAGAPDQDQEEPAEPDTDVEQTELEPEDDGDDDDADDSAEDDAADDEGEGNDADEDADDEGAGELPEMEATEIEQSPEMIEETQATWDEYEEISETQLRLELFSGNPTCYGVRTVVEEDEDEVRIAAITGTLPEAEDQACTQEALYVSVDVELEEPLGDREVVQLEDVDLEQ